MIRAVFMLTALAVTAKAIDEPKLRANGGHLYLTSGPSGVEKNVTDLLEASVAERQFRAVDDDIRAVVAQLKDSQESGTKVLANVVTAIDGLALEFKASANASSTLATVDTLLSEKIYWLGTDMRPMTTNEAPYAVNIIGVGFKAHYNPLAPPFFTCIWKAAGKADVKTDATVVAGEKFSVYYTIRCMSPGSVTSKAQYGLSLTYEDGKGSKSIPFQGKKGRDTATFDMEWTAANKVGSDWIIDVVGLNLKQQYTCIFTDAANAKYKKITVAAFASANKNKLNCGKQPFGFQVKGTISLVSVAVAKAGTTEFLTYTGSGSAPQLSFDNCANDAKDGTESDADCGGKCSSKCGSLQTCNTASDCVAAHGLCVSVGSQKKCVGGTGTQASPGNSCLQIRNDHNQKKNGVYWVKGVQKAVTTLFKVYCWMADRQGGGWTLGLTTWYHQPGWNSYFTTPNARGASDDARILRTKQQSFKLSDRQIQAVVGQEPGQMSKFDVMADQVGVNTYYSYQNYEYTIMENYNAVWSFVRGKKVPESKTKATLKVYYWKSGSFNGITPMGDGLLNWEGQPRCGWGDNNKAGIACNHIKPGSNSPQGGRGCKVNRSRNRWASNLHWYMSNSNSDTYFYLCNGAQHSSSHNMNHRWWFRSSKGIEY